MTTQPTWPDGNYTLTFTAKDAKTLIEIPIMRNPDIACPNHTTNEDSSFKKSQTCIAGKIETIGEKIEIDGKKHDVLLTPFTMVNSTDTTRAIAEACYPGEIAVFYSDNGTSSKKKNDVGMLYCNSISKSVNQHLYEKGLFIPTEEQCEKTNFKDTEWIMRACEAIKEIVEEKQAMDNCAIAFVTKATYLALPVQELREFRESLGGNSNPAIASVHSVYYMISPHLTEMARGNTMLKDAMFSAMTVPILTLSVLVP